MQTVPNCHPHFLTLLPETNKKNTNIVTKKFLTLLSETNKKHSYCHKKLCQIVTENFLTLLSETNVKPNIVTKRCAKSLSPPLTLSEKK